LLEHNEEYISDCYYNGFMPKPNNKLTFIINYVIKTCPEISVAELESDFPSKIFEFNGYYIQMVHGLGTITQIYNIIDLDLLVSL
jgi:hypothetical protein